MRTPGKNISHARRAFLRGTMLTAEGRQRYHKMQRALGPSPPWHHGRLYADVCAECGQLCASSCEQNIIEIHPVDHAMSGMPYLNFENAGCTWCGRCADVCPLEIQRETLRPRFGQAMLDTTSCLAWNGVFCISCHSHCDYQAIQRDQHSRIRLDGTNCTGCGSCISVCPVAAITLQMDAGPSATVIERPSEHV